MTSRAPEPAESVSNACASDLRALCASEADVLALLRAAPDTATQDAAARLCLARHVDALSPRCVSALVADALGGARGPDDDSSVEISIHYSRHHRGATGGAALSAAAPLSASEVAHSLLWLAALPFCLLGLFVATKRAAVYVRRRREERRIECKQQYVPVQ